MRRQSPNVETITRQRDHLLNILEQLDAERVARELEPFVSDERRKRLCDVFSKRLDSVTAVMDAPHDPHNGAAVIRTCDAFGIHRLHVVERLESFLAARTVSKGSERWVDVISHSSADAAIAALKANRHTLVATHPDGDLLPSDLRDIPRPALVLGNERDGIEEALRSACTETVRIPMRGFVESLNVSVTAAILLSTVTMDRPGDLPIAERHRTYARALILSVPRAARILDAKGIHIPDFPMSRDAEAGAGQNR